MQNHNYPSISVIICAYNHEKWIEKCLQSLIKQKNIKKTEYEIIIVDDASEDKTTKLINKFKKYKNIKIIKNKINLGLPASLNKALKLSNGKYIVRVDSDDFVSEYFLSMTSLSLKINKYIHAIEVDYFKVDDKENIISYNDASKKNIACGIMFRRKCLFDVGLYNSKFKMREGHELRKRFIKDYKIGRLILPLYKYRMHFKNRTKQRKNVKFYDSLLK